MSSITTRQSSRSRVLHDELSIVNWPLRDDLAIAWLLVAAELACGIVAAAVTGSIAMGVVSFLALALAGWRLWVPVRFSVGPQGIVQQVFRRRRRIAWHHVADYRVRRRGILLLPHSAEIPLSTFRGLFIAWNGKRDELLATVERYTAYPSQKSSVRSQRT